MPLARELLFGKLKDGGNLTIEVVDNAIALKAETNETVEAV